MRHQLEIARGASSGRSDHTIYGGHEHILRQTMIALRAGSELHEHENPGEATVQVLHGRVTLAGRNDGGETALILSAIAGHNIRTEV